MTTKQEKFKAVDYMRKKREELSRLHAENPALYKKQLEEVQKKYGIASASSKKRGITSPTRKQGRSH
jgi:hypothetical protein